ncbi:TetR/AcrR family transcriptional regulator [Nocardioides sp. HDW12B]|uniref:TetR/AcrR family transcriptional regulator n=1 Tax=Nocardioides sp. HDW12B TaxID=2714939 RepID=UPI0014085DA0|nr:TetR/AcrR family transcriptional regulator [Nocardioides sp. HDW12B]QIK65668.1 TetR/AcrR family transcriptional regulator [Nocardioides sp. HDW12B]
MTVRARRAHTKRALVSVARDLFARQGFAATSLEEIVAGADVTKGALYHHFRGKQDLYGEVLATVEDDARERIRARIADVADPWERALVGLREFLTVAQGEEYRRIVILEGPVVLGYERFREQEERSTYGLVQDIVGGLLSPYDLPESQLAAFTRLFFGAMSATASAVAQAPDPQQAADDAEGAVVLVLAGIRSLLDD